LDGAVGRYEGCGGVGGCCGHFRVLGDDRSDLRESVLSVCEAVETVLAGNVVVAAEDFVGVRMAKQEQAEVTADPTNFDKQIGCAIGVGPAGGGSGAFKALFCHRWRRRRDIRRANFASGCCRDWDYRIHRRGTVHYFRRDYCDSLDIRSRLRHSDTGRRRRLREGFGDRRDREERAAEWRRDVLLFHDDGVDGIAVEASFLGRRRESSRGERSHQ
jgi:hypothetical protein